MSRSQFRPREVQARREFRGSFQGVFAARGHDCQSVPDEGLSGAPDERVLEAASAEDRVLVTMDHDFGNVLEYPPARTAGIAVIEPRGRATPTLLRALLKSLIVEAEQGEIRGRLWIVEPARIREHDPGDLDEE